MSFLSYAIDLVFGAVIGFFGAFCLIDFNKRHENQEDEDVEKGKKCFVCNRFQKFEDSKCIHCAEHIENLHSRIKELEEKLRFIPLEEDIPSGPSKIDIKYLVLDQEIITQGHFVSGIFYKSSTLGNRIIHNVLGWRKVPQL